MANGEMAWVVFLLYNNYKAVCLSVSKIKFINNVSLIFADSVKTNVHYTKSTTQQDGAT